jgi:hypothetical protein
MKQQISELEVDLNRLEVRSAKIKSDLDNAAVRVELCKKDLNL